MIGRAALVLLALSAFLALRACAPVRRTSSPSLPKSAIQFRDVAAEAGIDFALSHGSKTPLTTLETLGHGCAFVDFDGDGLLDIWLLGPNRSTLYRNLGNGRFQNVTEQAHVGLKGYWHGIAIGDFDGDGQPDACLVGYRCLALLRNNHGVFQDVTAASGVVRPGWGSSCAFGDLDGDGKPELIVGDYLEFGPQSVQLCTVGNVKTACGPKIYPARYPRVYRNLGSGKFADVTRPWGFDKASGKALGIALGDFNGDGLLDVAIANDEMPQDLFIRQPGATVRFRNEATRRGFAFLGSGSVQSGMGVDAADFNQDGREDLVTTNFQGEPSGLYRNDGDFFTEISSVAGLSEATFPLVGWGVRFLDADNDGQLDLVMANGHIQDNVQLTGAASSYPEPLLLFQNSGGVFHSLGAAAGEPFGSKVVGRGIATGDYDNDGRVDILVNNLEGHALLLHNESRTGNHWLGVDLVPDRLGRPVSGAVVAVGAQRHRVLTSGSIFSAHDPRAHFGLASGAGPVQVQVAWPDGKREQFRAEVDRYVRLTYGTGSAARAR